MTYRRILFSLLIALLSAWGLSAQQKGNSSLKVRLTDSVSLEPVSYATVYVSKDGTTEKAYYAMTDGDGRGEIANIPAGKYVFVAELMGYYRLTHKVELKEGVNDLGEMLMNEDITMLNEVVVTAVGNQVVVKKDTVEYLGKAAKAKSWKNKIKSNDPVESSYMISKTPQITITRGNRVINMDDTPRTVYQDIENKRDITVSVVRRTVEDHVDEIKKDISKKDPKLSNIPEGYTRDIKRGRIVGYSTRAGKKQKRTRY